MNIPFFKSKKEIPDKFFDAPAIGIKDIIAPSSISVTPNYVKIGERLAKSYFLFSFPRYLSTAWLAPIINMDMLLNSLNAFLILFLSTLRKVLLMV